MNPDSDICIGTDTLCEADPVPEGPALGVNNTMGEPPFALEVNNITTHPNGNEYGDELVIE